MRLNFTETMPLKTPDLIENHLIVIGSTLPYSFSTDYVRQTCKVLGKQNDVVVFLWGNALSLKEIFIQKKLKKSITEMVRNEDDVVLFSPVHFIPLRRFELIRQVNLFINTMLLRLYLHFKRMNRARKILWIFNYELYNMPRFIKESCTSLYDCVDYFSSLEKNTHKQIKNKEKKLIQNVDLFFVNSKSLKSQFKSQSAIVVPQGFDIDTFSKYNRLPGNRTIENIKRPIIGYIGSINYRLDYGLTIDLARSHPEWNFVFVGEKQYQKTEDRFNNTRDRLFELFSSENVHKIEKQPKDKIPPIISQMEVCIIPYDASIPFNRYCYPMKLMEYFYLGKPVVSTPIEELERFPSMVRIGIDAKEFSNHIGDILDGGWPRQIQKKQKQIAINNSWGNKAREISKYLQDIL